MRWVWLVTVLLGGVGCSKSAPAQAAASTGCADAGLIAVRMRSQGSHAAARVDMRMEIASGKLTGTGYKFADPEGNEPVPTRIDASTDAAVVQSVVGVLKGVCSPIETAGSAPPSAMGGGSTSYELIYADRTVAAVRREPETAGTRYRELTVEQFRKLGEVWPHQQP